MSFATTQWSEVRAAAVRGSDARQPLENLCRRYWYPLYAYLRRDGASPDDAADHLQDFFAELLSRRMLEAADPDRGRFRNFLLTACKNHVRNRHRRDRALKRGGGQAILDIDGRDAERRYRIEPATDDDASKLFDRRWALDLIDAAIRRIGDEMTAAGRGERFEALRELIAPSVQSPSHAEVAERLGTDPNNVKVAVHRLRRKFADYLRDEVAATTTPDQVDEELNDLMRALAG